MWRRKMLMGLGILAAGAASSAPCGSAARATGMGTLVLSGGIDATVKLSPANCTVGPGGNFAMTSVRGGRWDSLDLSASDPASARRGIAEVALDATGYATAPYAVADWIWTAKKPGRLVRPLRIAPDGTSGTIDVVLPVADSFQGPKATAVRVTARWKAGTCKA